MCPICRAPFRLPAEGITGLKRNIYIASILETLAALHVTDDKPTQNTAAALAEKDVPTSAESAALMCDKHPAKVRGWGLYTFFQMFYGDVVLYFADG